MFIPIVPWVSATVLYSHVPFLSSFRVRTKVRVRGRGGDDDSSGKGSGGGDSDD